ncbi:restriction endonuclease subunit S [Kocuria sp. CPCC 205235]|uniref:restriction endonuclease subunit S n=1 Tax=Kocuria sp. CPCC 205235 TaxID=3073549 RepID=UPI0034D48999
MNSPTTPKFPLAPIRRVTSNLDHLRVPLNALERAERPGSIPYWGANSVVDHVDTPIVDGKIILIGEDGAPFLDKDRPVAFSLNEPIWPNNHVHVLRATGGNDHRFISFALNAVDYRLYIKGSTRDKLNQADLSSINIPLPAPSVQRRIADYLDQETAEIDAFINDQQKFIELLVEHRMASVGTKIRYPSIFHDSSLLKHELAPLKRFGHVSLGKMLDTKAASGDDLHLDYLRAANVQPMGWLKLDDMKKMRFTTNEKRALDLREGDVVVVEGGVGGYGRAAFVPKDLPETGFQNSIIRVRPTLDNDGRYLTYALILLRHRGYITTVSSVASMPHFTAEKVARTPIPIATLDEQRGTADSLDDLWQSHEVLSSEAAQAIALARERRAALITAAVTGQIDVTAKNKPAAEQLEDDIAQGLYKES